MARSYALDTQAAKEANTGGKRITETGKYIGTITAAFYEKNQKGTESVNIMFVSENGQECGPLNLYTHNGDGKELAGYKALNALMTCCRVKALNFQMEAIDLYDYDEQKVLSKQKECAVELKGKKVGLVLQQEEYRKGSGEVGERMIIAAPFEASTELMAVEILSGVKGPQALGSYMVFIGKNPVRKLRDGQPSHAAPQGAPNGADQFDDDIPF